MRLIKLKFTLLAGALFLCSCASTVSAQEKKADAVVSETKSEEYLPDTAQGAVIVSDMVSMVDTFNSSDLGELLTNPEVIAFMEDLREKLHKLEDGKGLDLHISSDDVLSGIGGEVALAVLRPAEDRMAFCMLANVKGSEANAQDLLDTAGKQIREAKEKYKLQGGEEEGSFEEGGAKVKGMSLPRERGALLRTVVYSTIHSGWMIVCDDKETMIDLVKRVQGRAAKDAKSLADDKTYQTIMKRTDTGEDYGPAHIKWFVKPLGLVEAIKLRGKKDLHEQDIIGPLKKHGYGTVKGIGGKVGFGMDKYEMLAQSFCYAPPAADGQRFEGAARALDFSNDGSVDMLPENWIPENASSYSVMVLDIKNAFEKSIPLLEELFARKGAIRKGLDGIRDDPQGAQVDIENDILAQLGKKISVATNTKLPVGIDSEQLLLTVKIDGDEPTVRMAVDKYLAQQKKQGGIEIVEYKTFTLWVINTKEMRDKKNHKEDEGFDLEFGVDGGIPGADCDFGLQADSCGNDNDSGKKDDPKEGHGGKRLLAEPLVKTQVFTVANGHLIVTNSVEYTKRLIDAAIDEPEKTLRKQEMFVRVDKALNELLPDAISLRRFVRLDESYRLTYELMREGKLPQSNSLLGTILKGALKQDEGEPIDLEVDGSLLPEDFDKDVAPFLGCLGWCTRTEEDGWLMAGALISNHKVLDEVKEEVKEETEDEAKDQAKEEAEK